MEVSKHYHFLRYLNIFIMLIGWVMFIGGGIYAFTVALAFASETDGGRKIMDMVGGIIAFSAAVAGIGFILMTELVACFIAIEQNTRTAATILQKNDTAQEMVEKATISTKNNEKE